MISRHSHSILPCTRGSWLKAGMAISTVPLLQEELWGLGAFSKSRPPDVFGDLQLRRHRPWKDSEERTDSGDRRQRLRHDVARRDFQLWKYFPNHFRRSFDRPPQFLL